MLTFFSLSAALLPAVPADVTSRTGLTRRALMVPGLAAATVGFAQQSTAADLRPFKDSRYGVSFGILAGWEATPNELADGRRLVLASDPSNSDTNIFIAFTPIRPDYSSLGSFGNIDYVASTVIPSCGQNGACRFANGDAIEGRMIASSVRKGNYVYDYTIEQKNGPTRHLLSLFTVQADAGASILVSLTAQCLDSNYAELAPTFNAVIESYKP